jgi:hypothetical protein
MSRIIGNILTYLIFEMGDQIWDSVTYDEVIKSYLSILDDVLDLAFDAGNDQLSNSVLNIFFGIHSRLTILSNTYSPDIRHVMYGLAKIGIVKPIKYAEDLVKSGKDISEKREQVLSAIEHTLNNAVKFIYYLCKHHYKRTDEETLIYLQDNIRVYVDLLNAFTNLPETVNIIKEKLDDHEKNIVRLAVYLFMQVENKVFPKEWLVSIVYPLAESCAPFGFREGWDSIEEVINKTIHLRDFPSEQFDTREMFSIAPVFVPNIGLNHSYSPYKFWICYAIYRKKFYQDRKYIPEGLAEDPLTIFLAGETIAHKLLSELATLEVEELAFLGNLSLEEAEKEGNLYVNYLEGLLKKNDERIEKLRAGTLDPNEE